MCLFIRLYICLHVLRLLGSFSAWSHGTLSVTFTSPFLSVLSLPLSIVLPSSSAGSHTVLSSAALQRCLLPRPFSGSPFAAAAAAGTVCGKAYSFTRAKVERCQKVTRNVQNTMLCGRSQAQKNHILYDSICEICTIDKSIETERRLVFAKSRLEGRENEE